MAETQGLLEGATAEEGDADIPDDWTERLVEQKGRRGYTDIAFLVLFFVYVLAMAIALPIKGAQGDLNRLRHGQDHDGYTCGVGAARGFPYLYWPHDAPGGQDTMAVHSQAEALKDPIKQMVISLDRKHQRAVCTSACPTSIAESRPNMCPEKDMQYCNWYADRSVLLHNRYCVFSDPYSQAVGGSEVMQPSLVMDRLVANRTQVASTNINQTRSAIDSDPDVSSARKASTSTSLNDAKNALDDLVFEMDKIEMSHGGAPSVTSRIPTGRSIFSYTEDLFDDAGIIVLAASVSIFVAVVYMALMGRFLKPFLLFCLVAVLLGCLGGGAACMVVYNEATATGVDSTWPLVGSISFGVASVVILIALGGFFFAERSLQVSLQLLQISLQFALSLPSMIFLAVVNVLVQMGLFFLIALAILLLISSAPIQSAPSASSEPGRYLLGSAQVALIFSSIILLVWVANYLSNVLHIACAHAVGKWYFDPQYRGMMGAGLTSYTTAITYHSGTAAFGALIMGIVRIIQFIVDIADATTQSSNAVLSCVGRCLKLLLLPFKVVLELVQLINSGAYALCGLDGTNFCSSAAIAMGVCKANAASFAFLQTIAFAVRTLGCLVGGGMGFLVAYLMMSYQDTEEIIFPLIFAFVVCWLAADSIMSLMVAVGDAFFFSFIADEAIAKKNGLDKGDNTPEPIWNLFEEAKKSEAEKAGDGV